MRWLLLALALLLAAPAAAQTVERPEVYSKKSCLELAKRSDAIGRGERSADLREGLGICISMFTCGKAKDLLQNDETLDYGEGDQDYFNWLMRTCGTEGFVHVPDKRPSPTATGNDAECQKLAGTIDHYYRTSDEARQRGDTKTADRIKDNIQGSVSQFVDDCLRAENCPQLVPIIKSKEFLAGAADFSAYRKMYQKRKEICP